MSYTLLEQQEIENAIKYLTFSIQQSGKNPKPVILHSIRVGMYLYIHDYPKDIVISGILHDLLEDTDVSFNDIKGKFGDKVARLVQACSFDESIKDKKEQYKELYARCLKEGKEAIIVKTADLIDNLPYMLNPQYAKGLHDALREKMGYFIELARTTVHNEKIFQELEKLFGELTNFFPFEANLP